ncbi:hypothetical protein QDF24_001251 [Escherichia coli]|nr:hypothetical protein [Escherichia coli]
MKQHNPVNSARSILLISIPERLFKIFPFLPASEIKKNAPERGAENGKWKMLEIFLQE